VREWGGGEMGRTRGTRGIRETRETRGTRKKNQLLTTNY
jgi:hypothetical protein